MGARLKPIRGFLLDITGVLYNSSRDGLGIAIPGAVEAVKKLYEESVVRFVTNESSSTRDKLFEKLTKLGFAIKKEHIFMPAPVAKKYLQENNMRPHLLVHKDIMNDLEDLDTANPNCVLMGDAAESFTYDSMNAAFRVLHGLKDPVIVTLGCGKFYQRVDGPCLDVGGFARALQFACDAQICTIGKPNEQFFMAAIDDMGLTKDEVVMIGDDIVSDVRGAQMVGIRGVQVRCGKWRESWESHTIKPDFIADDLRKAVDLLLTTKSS